MVMYVCAKCFRVSKHCICDEKLNVAPEESVNHPKHYNQGKFEVIDVIEDWKLGFNDGNAVKYIARHMHKANPIEDIKKAIWYLNRHLQNLEEVKNNKIFKEAQNATNQA